jgi:lysophospholipase L1-like esterase
MKRLLFSLLLLSSFALFPISGQTSNGTYDIVFIGNSITQGVQLANAQEESPPAFATRHFSTLRGVVSANFLNRGRSGYTTLNFLPSADGELSKVIAATKTFHTDETRTLVFSISLGTNDSAEEGPKGSPVSPADYHKNMKLIASQLMTDFPGCKIIFQQPVWYSPNTYNRARYLAAGLARLQTYFPELKALVAEFSTSNPGQVYMGDTKAYDYFMNNYLTDFIPENGNAGTFYLHPNKKGAEALGKFWGEGIHNALAK